jgi:nicotinate dehydrogenase subunit A
MKSIRLRVNGKARAVECEEDEPLLYVLRNALGLKGAHFGCGLGQCGACTVLVNGEPVRSCVMPATAATGQTITTIESLSDGKKLHPVQQAFIDQQAVQCGYCINGMVMSAVALLKKNPRPKRQDIESALAGNLCRCGTHQRIVDAVSRAALLISEPKALNVA